MNLPPPTHPGCNRHQQDSYLFMMGNLQKIFATSQQASSPTWQFVVPRSFGLVPTKGLGVPSPVLGPGLRKWRVERVNVNGVLPTSSHRAAHGCADKSRTSVLHHEFLAVFATVCKRKSLINGSRLLGLLNTPVKHVSESIP